MVIKRISCPHCTSINLQRQPDGDLRCLDCDHSYHDPVSEMIPCKACYTPNPPLAHQCSSCGLSLGDQCQVCGQVNPPGAAICNKCGEKLDIIETLYERRRQLGHHNQGHRANPLVESKAADNAYLDAERERIQSEEAERIARLREKREQGQKEQQRMILMVVIGVSIVAVIAILIILGVSLATP